MNKTKIIFRWALGSVALSWKFKRAGSFPPNWKILVLIITLWIAGIHDVDFGSITLPWEFKRAGCFPPILVLIIILWVTGIHFIDIFGGQSFSRFCYFVYFWISEVRQRDAFFVPSSWSLPGPQKWTQINQGQLGGSFGVHFRGPGPI